ncbi:unnamed protein product [Closterium sp. Naga37s-1]|nr:unnamed protein product [Closterium sp. Naga37s-1]
MKGVGWGSILRVSGHMWFFVLIFFSFPIIISPHHPPYPEEHPMRPPGRALPHTRPLNHSLLPHLRPPQFAPLRAASEGHLMHPAGAGLVALPRLPPGQGASEGHPMHPAGAGLVALSHLPAGKVLLPLLLCGQWYCCRCCSAANGCDVVRPDWLANATYMGRDYVDDVSSTKWKQQGLQNNYYWHSEEDVPMRIYMEPVEQMTFSHASFEKPHHFPNATFDLPSDMDCSQLCYGFCALVRQTTL